MIFVVKEVSFSGLILGQNNHKALSSSIVERTARH